MVGKNYLVNVYIFRFIETMDYLFVLLDSIIYLVLKALGVGEKKKPLLLFVEKLLKLLMVVLLKCGEMGFKHVHFYTLANA